MTGVVGPGAVWLVLRATVLVVVAALLQVTVAADLEVLDGRPDLVVIAVASIAILQGPSAGAVAGFAGGFLVDSLGLGVIGSTSLTLVAVAYGVGVFGEGLRRTAAVRPLLAIGAASLAAGAGQLTLALLVGSVPQASPALALAIVPGAMLDVLLAIGLYPAVRLLLRRRGPRTVSLDLGAARV